MYIKLTQLYMHSFLHTYIHSFLLTYNVSIESVGYLQISVLISKTSKVYRSLLALNLKIHIHTIFNKIFFFFKIMQCVYMCSYMCA